MALSAQKELFSRAFVHAVAAAAGFNVLRPEVDDDSVDLEIADRGRTAARKSACLQVQLKCTAAYRWQADDTVTFKLKKKNYEDLRIETHYPRLLVLVLVPRRCEKWVTQTPNHLELRHSAYWISLAGMPPSSNSRSVSLPVPRANIFSVESLTALMAKIAAGERP